MRILIITAILMMLFQSGFAAEIKEPLTDVNEIVTKANLAAYYQGADGKSTVAMTIIDSKEQKREREFTILRKDVTDQGDQKYYVYFKKPADFRNMIYVVHKHTAKDVDDDRWLYMPGLDLVKRVAASDKRTSFVGSDFLYEDVSGRTLSEDAHELVNSCDNYYVIKNTPKQPETVEFSYYNVSIDCNNFLPMKMDFYDKNGKLYRQIESQKVEKIGKFPTVTKSVVKNLQTGSRTEMVFSDVQYDIKLDDDTFSERYHRRPPREARR